MNTSITTSLYRQTYPAWDDAMMELSPKAMKLLTFLGKKLRMNGLNIIRLTNKEICKEFKILQPHLSRSIKELKKHSALVKIEGGYMLNPRMTWKGDVKDIQLKGIPMWSKAGGWKE